MNSQKSLMSANLSGLVGAGFLKNSRKYWQKNIYYVFGMHVMTAYVLTEVIPDEIKVPLWRSLLFVTCKINDISFDVNDPFHGSSLLVFQSHLDTGSSFVCSEIVVENYLQENNVLLSCLVNSLKDLHSCRLLTARQMTVLTIDWPEGIVGRQWSCSVHSAKIDALQYWTALFVVASLFGTNWWRKIKMRPGTWILETVNVGVTVWLRVRRVIRICIGAGRLVWYWAHAPSSLSGVVRYLNGSQKIETRWVVVASRHDIAAGWGWECSLGTLICACLSAHRQKKVFSLSISPSLFPLFHTTIALFCSFQSVFKTELADCKASFGFRGGLSIVWWQVPSEEYLQFCFVF